MGSGRPPSHREPLPDDPRTAVVEREDHGDDDREDRPEQVRDRDALQDTRLAPRVLEVPAGAGVRRTATRASRSRATLRGAPGLAQVVHHRDAGRSRTGSARATPSSSCPPGELVLRGDQVAEHRRLRRARAGRSCSSRRTSASVTITMPVRIAGRDSGSVTRQNVCRRWRRGRGPPRAGSPGCGRARRRAAGS